MRIREQVGTEEAHAHQLLADGRGAGDLAAGRDVLQKRPHDSPEVDAWIGPEGLVLRGHLGVDHDRWDLGVGNYATLLGSEGGQLHAIRRDDARSYAKLECHDLA